MNKFQIVGLILAEIFLKCIILVTNFHKSSSAGDSSTPERLLTFDFGVLKLRDLAKLCFFHTDYDEIKT